jgi:hypothetical protein
MIDQLAQLFLFLAHAAHHLRVDEVGVTAATVASRRAAPRRAAR